MGKVKNKMKFYKDKIFEKNEDIVLNESDEKVSKRVKKIQIVALVCFVSALVVILLTRSGNVSIESITENAQGDSRKSILSLMFLFAIKSLTIVIPLPSLYVASGILFSPLKAVLVSYLGLAITLTIPFILGRWSGAEEMEYIKKKYPKIEKVIEMQERNEFLASFVIRLIGWFPCDVLSFYFGACKTNYLKYITSALLGCSIGVITNTLLGDVILNPFSWQFIVLLLIKIAISASVIAITYRVNKGKNSKK
ncbi:MAG: VTT domain-containing protein [Peptoniphilus lacydonensis]|uniref:TVP38/TMEM64 family protein n=1 Tax=Peptoniphilus lacydonensis TaxID=1673725 RepID=UPI0029030F77|nr:VTT domain-containing protein [Peptoniphilus lacydonensis]MDU1953975.1 VTT domain-containing protein [Peptoniphilus lacydonensis]MDU5275128.1 VTT domain-containing protein [Peptoniphilus lacydonensis]